MDYGQAKREAQARADATGFDHGVEKLGSEYRFWQLPERQNRFGHELRCEVVMCTTLARCMPGHGPATVKPQSRRKRIKVDRGMIYLDGRQIGALEKRADGWLSTAWPTNYREHSPTQARAILRTVHSYASWIGWYHVIVDRGLAS